MEGYAHKQWENLNVPRFMIIEACFFVFECLLIHPFDVIRCKLQVSKERKLSWRGIRNVVSQTGLRGLYTAFSMDFLYIPGNVIYFVTYFFMQDVLQKQQIKWSKKKEETLEKSFSHPLWATCVAAMIADLTSILFFCPIEVAQQRMYLQSDNNIKKYSSNFNAFKTILRDEGIFGFYKGFVPLAVNTVPASAAWWSSYETLKRQLSRYARYRNEKNKRELTWSDRFTQDTIIQAISGGVAGAVSTILTNPLDVIRTRMQTEINETKNKNNGNLRVTLQMIKNIYTQEGSKALFKGLGPRLVQWSTISSLNAFLFETALRNSRIVNGKT